MHRRQGHGVDCTWDLKAYCLWTMLLLLMVAEFPEWRVHLRPSMRLKSIKAKLELPTVFSNLMPVDLVDRHPLPALAVAPTKKQRFS